MKFVFSRKRNVTETLPHWLNHLCRKHNLILDNLDNFSLSFSTIIDLSFLSKEERVTSTTELTT